MPRGGLFYLENGGVPPWLRRNVNEGKAVTYHNKHHHFLLGDIRYYSKTPFASYFPSFIISKHHWIKV